MPAHRKDVRERLEANRKIDPVTGCWEWTRSRGKKGYGQIWIVDKFVRVSRAAYEVYIGPIPEGKNVLHRCDNPPCFNPDHLWAGTQQENVQDCIAKGRANQPKPQEFCNQGHPKPYRGGCKICRKEYVRAWYLKNQDITKQRTRQRYWSDPEKARQEEKDRRLRDPEAYYANRRAIYSQRKEQLNARRRKRREDENVQRSVRVVPA